MLASQTMLRAQGLKDIAQICWRVGEPLESDVKNRQLLVLELPYMIVVL